MKGNIVSDRVIRLARHRYTPCLSKSVCAALDPFGRLENVNFENCGIRFFDCHLFLFLDMFGIDENAIYGRLAFSIFNILCALGSLSHRG